MENGGHIELILGPMFSGKTTELIRRMRRYSVANKRTLLIKYRKDNRYSEDCASTHDSTKEVALPAEKLKELEHAVKDYDVVGVDEGQFFPDLVQCVEEYANNGKIVIIAALDGTFQRKPFGSVLEVIPLCEEVTKLNAVCMVCYRDAAFSKRIGTETEIQVIGGADKYLSVCRQCFNSPFTTDRKKSSPSRNGRHHP